MADIKISTELEGDRDGTVNYRFSRLGEPVPVTSDENFKFDIENLPSRPLAYSELFGLVFVAHLNGFYVARTEDVINSAIALREGGEGSSIQELSLMNFPLGKVSILALSAPYYGVPSHTLAASVGSKIYFFKVRWGCEWLFSISIDGSSCIKDMQWSPRSSCIKDKHWMPYLLNKYVVLTSAGKLYGGAGRNHRILLDDVDAVNWSMNGKYLAVAKRDCLIILSSKFEEKVRIELLFDSLVDGDADRVVKVDCIRWVRPDCIMLGCYCLSADGKEENHAVRLISVKDGDITNTSSNPVALTFSSPYLAINEDDIPSGSGPYTLVSYLHEFDLAFVANKRNTCDHIGLFVWSPDNENGAEMLDIIGDDNWMPTIDLPANGDDAMILGLAIDKFRWNRNDTLVCGEGEKETEVSPCCILMCLTVDGKLFLFNFASAVGPSVLPEEVNYVSDEE